MGQFRTSVFFFFSEAEAISFFLLDNRLHSYSHGCTGNEHEREADAGKSF